MSDKISIGSSMHIKGELSGKEDLAINGRVDGKILMNGYQLTIEENGHVTAEIHAGTVIVRGTMIGNITADEGRGRAAGIDAGRHLCAARRAGRRRAVRILGRV